MRVVLLSRNRFLYSSRRLIKVARSAGHTVDVVNPLATTLTITSDEAAVETHDGVVQPDVVLPRIGQGLTEFGLVVVRQFERAGVAVVNGADGIACARDKVRTLQRLCEVGVPTPTTVVGHAAIDVETAVDAVGGLPVVVKTNHGTQGVGVMLFDNLASVRAILETMWAMGQSVMVQRFVAESAGRDVRAIVVDGEVIASMRRASKDGDFRANIHRGASGEAVELDDVYRDAALRSAAAVGLAVCGVDMLEADDGPRVIEVNSTPGLEGIERITDVNVAQRVVEYAEGLAASGGQGPTAAGAGSAGSLTATSA